MKLILLIAISLLTGCTKTTPNTISVGQELISEDFKKYKIEECQLAIEPRENTKLFQVDLNATEVLIIATSKDKNKVQSLSIEKNMDQPKAYRNSEEIESYTFKEN